MTTCVLEKVRIQPLPEETHKEDYRTQVYHMRIVGEVVVMFSKLKRKKKITKHGPGAQCCWKFIRVQQ